MSPITLTTQVNLSELVKDYLDEGITEPRAMAERAIEDLSEGQLLFILQQKLPSIFTQQLIHRRHYGRQMARGLRSQKWEDARSAFERVLTMPEFGVNGWTTLAACSKEDLLASIAQREEQIHGLKIEVKHRHLLIKELDKAHLDQVGQLDPELVIGIVGNGDS